MEHDSIAHRLGQSRWQLDRLGWVTLAGPRHGIFVGEQDPTQPQRDRVFDWCTESKIALPFWMEPKGDDG
jgi:hypothetical protein